MYWVFSSIYYVLASIHCVLPSIYCLLRSIYCVFPSLYSAMLSIYRIGSSIHSANALICSVVPAIYVSPLIYDYVCPLICRVPAFCRFLWVSGPGTHATAMLPYRSAL
jgi:hypothetical protein